MPNRNAMLQTNALIIFLVQLHRLTDDILDAAFTGAGNALMSASRSEFVS